MTKSPAVIAIALLAATTQLVGTAAFSQTTIAPKSAPSFGPRDVPEPNGPAVRPGSIDIPLPNGPAMSFGPRDVPEPNGPAVRPGTTDIPLPNGPALTFGPSDIPAPNGPALVPAQAGPGMVPPTATPAPAPSMSLTDAQMKGWIDKKVYSSDDKKLGEIAAFARDPAGNITEMQADVGGFFGLGETRVRVMPAQFKFMADHVMLLLTAEQAKALPKIAK